MKTIACDNCEFEGQGETFDEWFKVMLEHNKTAHADMMEEMMAKPKEEGEKWMSDAKAKFDAA